MQAVSSAYLTKTEWHIEIKLAQLEEQLQKVPCYGIGVYV
jgi:hypothetical protein